MAGGLTRLEDAWARLLCDAAPLGAETVPLVEAHGRIAAADAVQRLTHPPADASAMDGWAVRWADMPGPWIVRAGEAAAGRPFGGELGPGEALRVFTGAAMPAGADTVVVQEDARTADGRLVLAGDGPPAMGAHVRRAGQDFRAGDVAVHAGHRLTAARLGLLAAGGAAGASVWRRPVVGLLATGDELVPPGEQPEAGGIVASHGAMLAALIADAGGAARELGLVRDDARALGLALEAARGCDVIVTVGGASVGDHDLVRPALLAAGATIDTWRVAIRPGKPLLFGRLWERHVMGLPGNPVSAYVCALLFLAPLVRRLAGAAEVLPATVRARLRAPMPANGARRDFVRATWERGFVAPLPVQDSAGLAALAAADCLIVRPEHALPASGGDMVDCIPLESRGGSSGGA